nr:MAG TPA: hypothetical protein [Caudoviricetes sp.]
MGFQVVDEGNYTFFHAKYSPLYLLKPMKNTLFSCREIEIGTRFS